MNHNFNNSRASCQLLCTCTSYIWLTDPNSLFLSLPLSLSLAQPPTVVFLSLTLYLSIFFLFLLPCSLSLFLSLSFSQKWTRYSMMILFHVFSARSHAFLQYIHTFAIAKRTIFRLLSIVDFIALSSSSRILLFIACLFVDYSVFKSIFACNFN